MLSTSRMAAIAAATFVCGLPAAFAADPITLPVDCAKGQSITQILKFADFARRPVVLAIKGACNENVTIDRDDVTLQGATGATVNAPDGSLPAIRINGTRVVVDKLTVNGGASGVIVAHVHDVMVTNSSIRSANQACVSLIGAHARILNNTIQNCAGDGVTLNQSSALLNNNQIMSNGGSGVALFQSSAQLNNNQIMSSGGSGIALSGNSAIQVIGNTITLNGSQGIGVTQSQASIATTTISGNGTNAALNEGARSGVGSAWSNVTINNSQIIGNSGRGIVASGGSLGLFNSQVNANGIHGVSLLVSATAVIGGGSISGNGAQGLISEFRGTVQITGTTIQNNASNGIALNLASKLFVDGGPMVTVSGNGGWGLYCNDAESSVEGLGQIAFSPPSGPSPGCTGF